MSTKQNKTIIFLSSGSIFGEAKDTKISVKRKENKFFCFYEREKFGAGGSISEYKTK